MRANEDDIVSIVIVFAMPFLFLYGINLFPVPVYLSLTFWHYLHALCLLAFIGWLVNPFVKQEKKK